MSEVRYSVNGYYFADFGVYVSESKGIADVLPRKKVITFHWAEYHGSSPDLSNPKFDDRNIELKCFIIGDNWQDQFDKFNAMIRDQFAKSGTQRLLIEPLGYKPLPYEVYMLDEVVVSKSFSKGQNAAVFTLKMIEPNPIKKVLRLTGPTLNLIYKCPTETEIFYGNGLKETAKGNVILSGKALANRVVSEYSFEGRNLVPNADFSAADLKGWSTVYGTQKIVNGIYSKVLTQANASARITRDLYLKKGSYVISVRIKSPKGFTFSIGGKTSTFKEIVPDFIVASMTFNVDADGSVNLHMYNVSPAIGDVTELDWIKVEKGSVATPFSVAPEDEKIIIIAGNVEDITGLTTNADVLWDKL